MPKDAILRNDARVVRTMLGIDADESIPADLESLVGQAEDYLRRACGRTKELPHLQLAVLLAVWTKYRAKKGSKKSEE